MLQTRQSRGREEQQATPTRPTRPLGMALTMPRAEVPLTSKARSRSWPRKRRCRRSAGRPPSSDARPASSRQGTVYPPDRQGECFVRPRLLGCEFGAPGSVPKPNVFAEEAQERGMGRDLLWRPSATEREHESDIRVGNDHLVAKVLQAARHPLAQLNQNRCRSGSPHVDTDVVNGSPPLRLFATLLAPAPAPGQPLHPICFPEAASWGDAGCRLIRS